MKYMLESDRWHELLTSRYVCEVCHTRFFLRHRRCPACRLFGHIQPLVSMPLDIAHDDEDVRSMIAQGQRVGMEEDGGEMSI